MITASSGPIRRATLERELGWRERTVVDVGGRVVLDSDEDVGSEEMSRYLDLGTGRSSGPNLGALLREAFEKKEKGSK